MGRRVSKHAMASPAETLLSLRALYHSRVLLVCHEHRVVPHKINQMRIPTPPVSASKLHILSVPLANSSRLVNSPCIL